MNNSIEFNVFHPECPSRVFFEKFADKWILLIVYTLDQQAQHFNQLKKSVLGISPKVLSQKLKILERDGMLTRTIHDDNVIRIEYALTLLGKAFAKTADQLKDWVEQNMNQVLEARAEFDTRHTEVR